MDAAETFQRQLLELSRFANRSDPISPATEDAYLHTPRHQFVSRYRHLGSKEWLDVDAGNLPNHLPALYTNGPLILSGDDDGDLASTISQPSLVLRMLDMLHVEPGHNVFELGAGSGWNAAMLGRLTGPAGHVYSIEIIPEMARRAAAAVQALGINNVSIIEADGGKGYAAAAPYDRAIFTAGTYELPRYFYHQIKEGGLLLVVPSGGAAKARTRSSGALGASGRSSALPNPCFKSSIRANRPPLRMKSNTSACGTGRASRWRSRGTMPSSPMALQPQKSGCLRTWEIGSQSACRSAPVLRCRFIPLTPASKQRSASGSSNAASRSFSGVFRYRAVIFEAQPA
jgi:protein-L-isoaspartate(D-aspartate) O-methyltransferase